ncbi:folate-biopterin transporter chloroplastic [Raphidocelis subcapitata]|uniref:Folate-biopterin transporter chloroplastic n=1 Tax=Raphidocelis subcapitata TaxID=307507 RepID=A0A2V0PHM7_9CHLO|nr:folate-biopterin transporter chloroplastic [Raphidocelis subcapitata]|eukprot:GBF96737.1 folate-biopterin transporter chloroplastic [Raphidocelis subcapitata]
MIARRRSSCGSPPRALPDPEHAGAHHELDEAALLLREIAPLSVEGATDAHMRRGGGGGGGASGAGAAPLADLAAGSDADADGNGKGVHKRRARFQLMGLDVTPELCAIALVYFVQGILGLSRLALSFYFKDDLKVDPAQVAVLTGIAGIPWMIKPLYGFISDSVPLFGYRRRSYLVICGFLGAASWTALATAVDTPTGAVAAMVAGALSTAASDVVVDSIVGTTGSLQSLCWGSSAVGGIASAYFSGSLVQAWGVHPVFAVTAAFPLLVSVAALLIDEPRAAAPPPRARGASDAPSPAPARASLAASAAALAPRLREQGAALWGAVARREILLPTVFVFLWQATPTADSAMFYYYTNELHFDAEFLGRVRLAGAVASLAGVALYNTAFKKVPLKRMFFWAMVSGTALGSTQLLLVSGANRALGLSDELFVLGDSVVLTVLGQARAAAGACCRRGRVLVSFMPVLVLAARLCPEGVEATLFATLMSILNGGAFVGSALGAGLTAAFGVTSSDFSHLFGLTLVCVASTLLPAPFLGLLPAALDRDETAGGGGGGGGGEGGGGDSGEKRGGGEKRRGGGGGQADAEEGVALLDRAERGDGGAQQLRGGGEEER